MPESLNRGEKKETYLKIREVNKESLKKWREMEKEKINSSSHCIH